MKDVNVVVGIILNGSKFLVERRRPNEKVDPSIVCLPGGHVRKNESMGEALEREMREELGIEVKDSQFVCKNLYVASNGERQTAYCFLITNYEGKPVCKSAQEVFWEDDIQNLSLKVDKQTLKRIREPGNSLLKQENSHVTSMGQ